MREEYEGRIQSLKKGKSKRTICFIRQFIIWEHKEETEPEKFKKGKKKKKERNIN